MAYSWLLFVTFFIPRCYEWLLLVGRNDNQKTKITNENSYLTLQLEFAYNSKTTWKRALALYHTDRKVTRINE